MEHILIKKNATHSEILLKCLPSLITWKEKYVKYFMNDKVIDLINIHDDKNILIILEGIENVTNIPKLKSLLENLNDKDVYAVSYSEKVNKKIEDLFIVMSLEDIIENVKIKPNEKRSTEIS